MKSKIKMITAFETADFRVFASYAAAKAHVEKVNAERTELKRLAAMQRADKDGLKKLWRDCDQKKRSELQSLISRRAALIAKLMNSIKREGGGRDESLPTIKRNPGQMPRKTAGNRSEFSVLW